MLTEKNPHLRSTSLTKTSFPHPYPTLLYPSENEQCSFPTRQQFFSLKRAGNQLEHALENYENSLEDQYRAETISREEYRNLDREIEKLEEYVDSAKDRLEITFGIDD